MNKNLLELRLPSTIPSHAPWSMPELDGGASDNDSISDTSDAEQLLAGDDVS